MIQAKSVRANGSPDPGQSAVNLAAAERSLVKFCVLPTVRRSMPNNAAKTKSHFRMKNAIRSRASTTK